MRQSKLSDEVIFDQISRLPGWKVDENRLVKTFEFPSFVDAIAFVDQLAVVAEKIDHHPDMDIRYNKVRIVLTTHDAGGVTINDFELAAAAERLASVNGTEQTD